MRLPAGGSGLILPRHFLCKSRPVHDATSPNRRSSVRLDMTPPACGSPLRRVSRQIVGEPKHSARIAIRAPHHAGTGSDGHAQESLLLTFRRQLVAQRHGALFGALHWRESGSIIGNGINLGVKRRGELFTQQPRQHAYGVLARLARARPLIEHAGPFDGLSMPNEAVTARAPASGKLLELLTREPFCLGRKTGRGIDPL
jgi:hypothetical protein